MLPATVQKTMTNRRILVKRVSQVVMLFPPCL